MPTYIDSDIYEQQRFRRSNVLAPWDFVGNSTSSAITKKSVTLPTAVKRVKPKDLFSGGTGRTTSSIYQATDAVSVLTSNKLERTDNRPIISVLGISSLDTHSRWAPLTDVNSAAMLNHIRNTVRGDSVNLAMAVAEYQQTAKLFLTGARFVRTRGMSLRSHLGQALRTERTVVKASTKVAAEATLAFNYGVKPLASDVIGSIDALKKACGVPKYLSGVESRYERGSDSFSTSLGNGYKCNVEFHENFRRRMQWRAKMTTDGVVRTLAAHGFTNPFALAYELIPFSFVVDWWINVGDVLASLDNLLLFEEIRVIESTSRIRGTFVSTAGNQYMGPGSCHRIRRDDVRLAPRSISLINTFQYKPSVSLQHILNGLSLLRTVRPRRS